MKKTKRFLAVVLCMLLMLTPLAVVAETVTVQAAEPQTVKVKLDKKTGKRYGYDENNQKVTQQWGVTAKGFRYYFGKNGAAYQADQDMVGKYGILMKKINGKYYGFDVSRRAFYAGNHEISSSGGLSIVSETYFPFFLRWRTHSVSRYSICPFTERKSSSAQAAIWS